MYGTPSIATHGYRSQSLLRCSNRQLSLGAKVVTARLIKIGERDSAKDISDPETLKSCKTLCLLTRNAAVVQCGAAVSKAQMAEQLTLVCQRNIEKINRTGGTPELVLAETSTSIHMYDKTTCARITNNVEIC